MSMERDHKKTADKVGLPEIRRKSFLLTDGIFYTNQ